VGRKFSGQLIGIPFVAKLRRVTTSLVSDSRRRRTDGIDAVHGETNGGVTEVLAPGQLLHVEAATSIGNPSDRRNPSVLFHGRLRGHALLPCDQQTEGLQIQGYSVRGSVPSLGAPEVAVREVAVRAVVDTPPALEV
jgi:hypothetical protein